MGPPRRPAPKKKENSTSAYATSSSSRVNWKTPQNSAPNSSTFHNGTSSRSHSTSEPESRVILALSEGRGDAMCEVGIAAVNIATPSLILCQISDSHSYVNTLTKINILNPSEILIPLTFIDSFATNRLIQKVKEQFSNVKITGVPRNTFNKTNGLQNVKNLCVPSMNSILLMLQHRYYALAAAAALLAYTESTLYVFYAHESIKIEYQESEGATIIDVGTADRLELVASARPTMKKRYSCLLDVLNNCCTKMGTLTLRASILQPPCSVPDIEARLNCVTELKEHPEMLRAIREKLQILSNIDQLLSLAAVLPDRAQNCSERQLNYILLLNSLLEQIIPLRDIFENSKQAFFVELCETLGNPAFDVIKEIIRTLIHADAHPAKGQQGIVQRCFAIKSGVNGLLDVVRKTYSERLDEMREYVKGLAEQYSLALTLSNNQKKGYHIVLTLNTYQKKTYKKNDIPAEFIQVERLSNTFTMKTQQLIDLSTQVEDINLEILKMSNIMIYKILIQIRKQMGVFYKLCEDIAKLDMLQSLAVASSAMHYVRPKFADYLEILEARHPLLDFLLSVEPTANLIYASEDYNMNIITGPNGSGKSIFIRQVVLIQVMAQVGCYVPAESATLRVADRILARVYLEDNMACGISAFVLEIKEIQYFLNVLTKNTLIIVDELCRSTSLEEGTALAMALCEKLMRTPAFIFFTTHFKLLTRLQDLHFNVKTWQLETPTETINHQIVLRFTYSVIPGVVSLEHYGFFLAKGSWPEIIAKYAEDILHKLAATEKKTPPNLGQANPATRLKYDLEAEFKALKARKQLTKAIINQKLLEYQAGLRNLGHHIELHLFSEASTNYSRSFIQCNNSFEENKNPFLQNKSCTVSEANNNEPVYYDSNFYASLNNSDISLLNRVMIDDQCMNSVHINPDKVNYTQEIDFMLAELSQTERPSHTFQHQGLPNDSNTESVSVLQNSFQFHPHDMPNKLSNETSLPHPGYENASVLQAPPFELQPYGPSTLYALENQHRVFGGNFRAFEKNSSLQRALSQISVKSPQATLHNLSYSNIFEPEVIIESVEESITVQKEISHSYVHQSNRQNSSDQSNFSKQYSHMSVEKSYMPQSQPTPENELYDQDGSIYESACSGISGDSQIYSIASDKQDLANTLPNSGDYHNTSLMSVNELQFSLPLQQNVERTSTPIPAVHSQLGMPFYQRDLNYQVPCPSNRNWIEKTEVVFSGHDEQLTSHDTSSSKHDLKASTQPLKSDSATSGLASDSIKWCFKDQQAPKSNSANSDGIKLCLNAQKIKPTRDESTDDTSSKITTYSLVKSNGKDITDPILQNMSKSKNFDDAEITEILNDLQSYSECFCDSEEWDTINEDMKEQLTKSKGSLNSSSNHSKNLKNSTNFALPPLLDITPKLHGNSNMLVEKANDQEVKSQKKIHIIHQVCLKKPYSKRKPISNHEPQANIQEQFQRKNSTLTQFNPRYGQNINSTETEEKSILSEFDDTSQLYEPERSIESGYTTKVNQLRCGLSQLQFRDTSSISDNSRNFQDGVHVTCANDNKFQSGRSYDGRSSYETHEGRTDKSALQSRQIDMLHGEEVDGQKVEIPYNETNHIYGGHITDQSEGSKIYGAHQSKEIQSEYGETVQMQFNEKLLREEIDSQPYGATITITKQNRSSKLYGSPQFQTKQGKRFCKRLPEESPCANRTLQKEEIQIYRTLEGERIKVPIQNPKIQRRKDDGGILQNKQTVKDEIYEVTTIETPYQEKESVFQKDPLSRRRELIQVFSREQLDGSAASPNISQQEYSLSQYDEDILRAEFSEEIFEEPNTTQYESKEPNQHSMEMDVDLEKEPYSKTDSFEKPLRRLEALHKQENFDSEKEPIIQTPKLQLQTDFELHQKSQKQATHEVRPPNEDYYSKHKQLAEIFEVQDDHPTSDQNICPDSSKRMTSIENTKHSNILSSPKLILKSSANVPPSIKIDQYSKNSKLAELSVQSNRQTNIQDVNSESSISAENDSRMKHSAILSSPKLILKSPANTIPFVQSQSASFSDPSQQPEMEKGEPEMCTNLKNVGQSPKCQKQAKTMEPFDTSLEPLGDVHLELFSDDSFLEESQQPLLHKQSSSTKSIFETVTSDIEDVLELSKLSSHADTKLKANHLNTSTEYETACSNASQQGVFETASSAEYFVLQQNEKRSKVESNGSPQPKRKRLGYISKARRNMHESNEENSPDIVENVPSKPPVKQTGKLTKPKLSKLKVPKFKPPKKLTKKEIEQDYWEQTKRIMESGSVSMAEQIINRPTPRQLQQTTHIASIHRTDSGILVLPSDESKPKKSKRRKFKTPLKQPLEKFDVSLFSDKNSGKFEEFMNPNVHNGFETKVHERQEVTAFQSIRSEIVTKSSVNCSQETPFSAFGENIHGFKNMLLGQLQKNTTTDVIENVPQASKIYERQEVSAFQAIGSEIVTKSSVSYSQETPFSAFGENIQGFKCTLLEQLQENVTVTDVIENISQASGSGIIKRGYYTQNKECIDNILVKYLNSGDKSADETVHSGSPKDGCVWSFSQETVLLEEHLRKQ